MFREYLQGNYQNDAGDVVRPAVKIRLIIISALLMLTGQFGLSAESHPAPANADYAANAEKCINLLMEYGTDRYGDVHAPIFVSILDVETHVCPAVPEQLDAYFRVVREARRNPAGSNLLTDQPMLKSMYLLSEMTGKKGYAAFADGYANYALKNCVDENGFFWWGWHRYYDVYRDVKDGHNGNPHEIHAMDNILWDRLWEVNRDAVTREIDAIWRLHVINKETGEINRHGDGRRGCDFSMSAGAYIEAFVFMYTKTQDSQWLDRAKLVADYYWNLKDPTTKLFPERPNAGTNRFDGYSFVTNITGLYCHSLLKAYEMTQIESFRDQAITYLKAYATYGFDVASGMFWGALNMDGTPIPGPRIFSSNIDGPGGYEACQPRGHLDLWEPYVAGYQYPIYTAQVYAYAYQLTKNPAMLITARRFADWIAKTPPGSMEMENAWYKGYSEGPGRQGTYAGKYGRTVSFLLHLYVLTGEQQYLDAARSIAESAIEKLYYKGLFRGHPAKPYYEAMDGVGNLLYALLQLDQVLKNPAEATARQAIMIENEGKKITVDFDNR